MKKYINITPNKFMKCPHPACPTILESENDYLIISPEVSIKSLPAAFRKRVGLNEKVLCVPKELLEMVNFKKVNKK